MRCATGARCLDSRKSVARWSLKQGGPLVTNMGEAGVPPARQEATVADLMRLPPRSNSRPDGAVTGSGETRSTTMEGS